MPSVINAKCRKQAHYAECHYAECHYAECRSAEAGGRYYKTLQIRNLQKMNRFDSNLASFL